MEEKETNALEMAAQENEEREKIKEAAQGWVRNNGSDFKLILILDSIFYLKGVLCFYLPSLTGL